MKLLRDVVKSRSGSTTRGTRALAMCQECHWFYNLGEECRHQSYCSEYDEARYGPRTQHAVLREEAEEPLWRTPSAPPPSSMTFDEWCDLAVRTPNPPPPPPSAAYEDGPYGTIRMGNGSTNVTINIPETPVLRASDVRASVDRLRNTYHDNTPIDSSVTYRCPSCATVTVSIAGVMPPAVHADNCDMNSYFRRMSTYYETP